ncbi:MAG: UbiD family decarboxylase [Planctomycetota bacterium]|nr:UbiD family decarboxylase [Planctomycetota bacterium]
MKHYDHLADFIADVEDRGELLRITDAVGSRFDLTRITQRACRESPNAPAVLFENVDGGPIPVITNLLGSEWRICHSLGVESLQDAGDRISALLKPELPAGWQGVLKQAPQLVELTKVAPKTVKSGPCQQVVHLGRDVDLRKLPIPHFWPQESGASLRGVPLFCVDPNTGDRHIGNYPLQVRDARSLVIAWNPHDWGWRIAQAYGRRNEQMPIAICLGGDPLLSVLADVPAPPQADKTVLAGYLRGSNVDLVKARSIGIEVPAHADIVIEGFIDVAAASEAVGPLASPSGFAGITGEGRVMQVSAVTTRSNPLVAFNVPGLRSGADEWLGEAVDHVLSPLVRWFVPEVSAIHRPSSGSRRQFAYVAIEKHFPLQARKVMNALWGIDWLSCSKMIVAVDADVNVRDEQAVWSAVASHCHPGADTLFSEGPAFFDDHATRVPGVGHRMGLDATRKLRGEGHDRVWPESLVLDA